MASGLYQTNSPEANIHCCNNSEANLLLVGEPQAKAAHQLSQNIPSVKKIVQLQGKSESKDILTVSKTKIFWRFDFQTKMYPSYIIMVSR